MPLLPVPHCQQHKPGECLAACAKMALDYLSSEGFLDDQKTPSVCKTLGVFFINSALSVFSVVNSLFEPSGGRGIISLPHRGKSAHQFHEERLPDQAI